MEPNGRRRFDHLHVEICVAVRTRVSRFALWLELREIGADPEQLAREDALAFCDARLERFLRARGLAVRPRAKRRLRRAVARFDPRLPTPYERLAALTR